MRKSEPKTPGGQGGGKPNMGKGGYQQNYQQGYGSLNQRRQVVKVVENQTWERVDISKITNKVMDKVVMEDMVGTVTTMVVDMEVTVDMEDMVDMDMVDTEVTVDMEDMVDMDMVDT